MKKEPKMEQTDFSKQDEFWDFSNLLPQKKERLSAFSHDTDTVLVESDNSMVSKKPSEDDEKPKKFSPVPKARIAFSQSSPPDIYVPEHPLLRKVSIHAWPSKYNFYERFRADALSYANISGAEVPAVSYFSYMPQYSQMKEEQQLYYFWLRDNWRKSVALPADSSYLLLYIYEIINLPDIVSPEDGLQQLCFIWLHYRDAYDFLDRILAEWVCDYCLIHHLTPPVKTLSPILGHVLTAATFREFYLSGTTDSDALFANVLINHLSPYQYRTSKYYMAETASLFDTHMSNAIKAVIHHYREDGVPFPKRDHFPSPAQLIRDSYSGAVCSYAIKKTIKVDYFSCSGSPELRVIASDLVKCIENGIRGMIGVRARFSIRSIPSQMKEYVSQYFAAFSPQKVVKKSNASEPEPEYLRQYDAISTEISPQAAQKMEQEAWRVTDRLTAAFAAEEDVETNRNITLNIASKIEDNRDAASPHAATELSQNINTASGKTETQESVSADNPATPSANAEMSAGSTLSPLIRSALTCLLDGDLTAFHALAAQNALLPDTLVEQINGACYDILGDIVVENNGNGAAIVECYRTDLEVWIHG